MGVDVTQEARACMIESTIANTQSHSSVESPHEEQVQSSVETEMNIGRNRTKCLIIHTFRIFLRFYFLFNAKIWKF